MTDSLSDTWLQCIHQFMLYLFITYLMSKYYMFYIQLKYVKYMRRRYEILKKQTWFGTVPRRGWVPYKNGCDLRLDFLKVLKPQMRIMIWCSLKFTGTNDLMRPTDRPTDRPTEPTNQQTDRQTDDVKHDAHDVQHDVHDGGRHDVHDAHDAQHDTGRN